MAFDTEYERLVAQTYDDVYSVVRDPAGDGAFYRIRSSSVGTPLSRRCL